MTLIGLLIVLLLAGVILWAAATYLPVPFNWIVVAVVIIVLLILLINAVGGAHTHLAAGIAAGS